MKHLMTFMLAFGFATTAALAEGRWLQVETKVNCAVWDAYPVGSVKDQKITWTGNCENERANGKGKRTWRRLKDGKWSKSIFIGAMRDGKLHGRGVLIETTGETYKGDWGNNKKNGRGVTTWAIGDKYVGGYRDNKRHGDGVYTYSNGDRYDGGWKSDYEEGDGVFSLANGEKCTGVWRKAKLLGMGTAELHGKRLKCVVYRNKITYAE